MKLLVLSVPVVFARDPYDPSWIKDPEELIDCNADGYNCVLDTADGDQSCRDAPYRICVATCSHTNGTCYDGCRKNPDGNLPKAACMHKALFPMLPNDLLLFLVLFLVAIAAGAAGIGGGGLNFPINMIIAQFDVKEAVPLSHAAVLGNAIAQLVMNCPQQHPKSKVRPLIHYELAFLLMPALLGGDSLGVVLNKIIPGTVVCILAMGMLILAGTKTVMKGCHVLHDSREAKKAALEAKKNNAITGPTVQQENPSGPPEGGQAALATPLANNSTDAGMRVPWKVIGMMICFNIFVLLDVLLQKSAGGCSALYWIALVGLYPFVFGALYFGIGGLKKLAQFHDDRGDGKIEGDPDVSLPMAIKYACATAVVGLLAGILGLGGGEFMVPLLLEFGLLPRVASATSGFLIVFGTSNNMVHYLIGGELIPILGYAVGCVLVANLGAFCGLILRDTKFMRENTHFLVFTLAGLLYTSMILTMYQGLIVDEISFKLSAKFC